MSEKKKKEGKKAKSEREGKEGKSGKQDKEGSDVKSKKEKDPTGVKEGGKKNDGTNKDSNDTKGGAAKETGDKKVGEASSVSTDPNALPPLDSDGNPICVQPDPTPTFAELWFDDPLEGEAAQKLALELKSRIELRALPIRKFLEGAIVPLLLQGLQHMVLERPTNPAEYLAAFLLRNNPLKDAQYVEPPVIPPATKPDPVIEPPKCSCCLVHCPPQPQQEVVPDFFRKSEKLDKTDSSKKLQKTDLQ